MDWTAVRGKIESGAADLPIREYAFVKPCDLPFSERVRYICRTECARYGTSWSCPPAVGTVEECRQRCLGYDGAFVFTTVAEEIDTADMQAMLETRKGHEEITRRMRTVVEDCGLRTLCMSGESCSVCGHCAYPSAPCRHPGRMLPCIEGYGIVVAKLAEDCGITFMNEGNTVTWFGLILYGKAL